TLLFLGYPPLMANVSNNMGLVAGGASASWGYRTELTGHGGTLRKLVPLSLLGAVVGATLLLTLPATAFKTIVPVLIVLALVLVIFGPRLQRAAATRHTDQAAGMPPWRTRALAGGVFVGGVYGGYFGAAQGVLLMGLFSALASEPIQRLTGFKNVLVTIVNTVAAIAFLLFAREHVSWPVVGLVAVGSFIGGLLGAVIGRRLPGVVLRSVIVVVGVLAIIKMVWFA
ncbi:MAG TPA: sulfite exporter TauE/SafE family protein, partial [Dermatophilaceae bacterium]|nr:sulfite exporter TauE/SafE family protein [Dermatophilaceae bacterium]